MEYLIYKFVTSFLIAYLFSLIVINTCDGIKYIWNRLHHNDSEWVDDETVNKETEED